MHDGCSGKFASGKDIADKVRMMGFDETLLQAPLQISCEHCQNTFSMEKMLATCPDCGMVYAVTPCHAHSSEFVKPAGIKY